MSTKSRTAKAARRHQKALYRVMKGVTENFFTNMPLDPTFREWIGEQCAIGTGYLTAEYLTAADGELIAGPLQDDIKSH